MSEFRFLNVLISRIPTSKNSAGIRFLLLKYSTEKQAESLIRWIQPIILLPIFQTFD